MLSRMRTMLLCFALGFGSIIGVPMRPEEISELMHAHNQPKLAHVIKDEKERDDPLKRLKLPRRSR